MKPNTDYYAVIDPDSGRLVWPRNKGYWTIKNKRGGDEGKTDPGHSTACQVALKAYREKEASTQAPTK